LVDRHRSAPEGFLPVRLGSVPHTARGVTHYDSCSAFDDALGQVRAALDDAGVRQLELPGEVGARPVLVADGSRPDKIAGALQTLAQDPAWIAIVDDRWPIRHLSLHDLAKSLGELPRRVHLTPVLAAPTGRVLTTTADAVTLEMWQMVSDTATPRFDGGMHEPGTLVAPPGNAKYDYLTPSAWAELDANGDDVPGRLPHLLSVTEPIDAVYTWVDGKDPEWIRRRDEAIGRGDAAGVHETAIASARFTDRDELRYSLRSLEMYANWINRIHIVTDGQVPDWLDTDHPRINLVDHRDIFSDPAVLPVFNSHAIESQLHHIHGLTNRYLYFNDDVFFGRPVAPELFFGGNGTTKFFPSSLVLEPDAPSERDMPVLAAAKNNRALLEQTFGRTVTHKFAHTPHPQSKPMLLRLEESFPDVFANVAASRFRSPQDVSIASSLHHYYAYAMGRAVPGALRFTYRNLEEVRSPRDFARLFDEPGYDVFCLNDTHDGPGIGDRVSRLLVQFLQSYYPLPSSFENSVHAAPALTTEGTAPR